MKASTAYISLGVNRASSCAACTSTGILAFGAGPYVALWDTQVRLALDRRPYAGAHGQNDKFKGVHATLQGHKGQVTAVKLVSDEPGRTKIVSGDTEGNVRVWEEGQGNSVRTSQHSLGPTLTAVLLYC